jgi:hypothetical protein
VEGPLADAVDDFAGVAHFQGKIHQGVLLFELTDQFGQEVVTGDGAGTDDQASFDLFDKQMPRAQMSREPSP